MRVDASMYEMTSHCTEASGYYRTTGRRPDGDGGKVEVCARPM